VGDNPVPALTAFALTNNGDGTYTLTLTGSGFVAASQARWNGADLPTTFVDSTQLAARIPLEDLLAGRGVITVVNPAPGGGTSRSLIYQNDGSGPTRIYTPLVLR